MGQNNSKKKDDSKGPSFEILASGTSMSCYCSSSMICCIWLVIMGLWMMANMQVASKGIDVVSKNPQLLALAV